MPKVGKGRSALTLAAGGLRRPVVVVSNGGVLVGSLDADVGDVDDVGPELLGER